MVGNKRVKRVFDNRILVFFRHSQPGIFAIARNRAAVVMLKRRIQILDIQLLQTARVLIPTVSAKPSLLKFLSFLFLLTFFD
jgi:hypothetical protein